eukprot:TRINITY_DN23819_c0_g1_i1.p1 TRINITY_DN23819_c0_g1~~TRINITY_DN23819_c0_g1_i1.p1  ORF type:complete len:257 (+),score=51.23 TRINITY_DN23819_c0_g1_i1:141-911(+)
MAQGGYDPKYSNSMDNHGWFGGLASSLDLARADSMELQNDPRFFHGNIIDKRLKAFKGLTIVSGLMLGTSMKALFGLKKDFTLKPIFPYVGYMQLLGFFFQMICTFMCITSLYIIAHQLFYTIRLVTSGPTGFEAASMFYLNKTMTMWRHFAIKCLMNGLWVFALSAGVQLWSKFYKDAENSHRSVYKPELNLDFHLYIGFAVLGSFATCAMFLLVLRRHHVSAFQEHYKALHLKNKPLLETVRSMQTRGNAMPEL